MPKSRISLSILALGVSLAVPALAADLGARREVLPPVPVVPQAMPEASGFYLRGDIGYTIYDKPDATAFGVPGGRTIENERLGKGAMFDVGAGYKFNNWFRIDVTGGYGTDAKYSSTNSGTAYTQGFSADKAKLQSAVVLANAYFDLGTWSGITPYVGAGVGGAFNQFKGFNSQANFYPGFYGCPATSTTNCLGGNPKYPDKTKTNFAYALMAGVAVDLVENLKLDVGYRYLNLGSATTGTDAGGIGASTKEITAHQIRAGLRWTFGGGYAPLATPQALTRKY
jgi:opacity protein-like surface antigen